MTLHLVTVCRQAWVMNAPEYIRTYTLGQYMPKFTLEAMGAWVGKVINRQSVKVMMAELIVEVDLRCG